MFCLKFRGAFDNLMFQRFVEAVQRFFGLFAIGRVLKINGKSAIPRRIDAQIEPALPRLVEILKGEIERSLIARR